MDSKTFIEGLNARARQLASNPNHPSVVRLSDLRSKLARIGLEAPRSLPEMLMAVRAKARKTLDLERIEEIRIAGSTVASQIALLADEIFAKAGSPVTLVTQPTGGLFGNNQSSASVPNQPQPSPAAAPAAIVSLSDLKKAHAVLGTVQSLTANESEQRGAIIKHLFQNHLTVPGCESEFSALAAQGIIRHPEPTGFARTVRNERQSRINQLFKTPKN